MRMIKPTGYFRRDFECARFERAKKDPFGRRLDAMLAKVTDMLASDAPLPANFHDHPLSGTFDDFRDCQMSTELVLIYRKPDTDTLELIRLAHDVFRLSLARLATEALPFEPLVPTTTTVAAIEEARHRGLLRFANSRALLQWLNAD